MTDLANIDYEGIGQKSLELVQSGRAIFSEDGSVAEELKPYLTAGTKRLNLPGANPLEQTITLHFCAGMTIPMIYRLVNTMYPMVTPLAEIERVTTGITASVEGWLTRQLAPLYVVLWVDIMHFGPSSGRNRHSINNIWGIRSDGSRELLGVYIGDKDKTSFWVDVFKSLQRRGVKDIIFAIPVHARRAGPAVRIVFPATEVQDCLVTRFRTIIHSLPSKDRREMSNNLTAVFQSKTMKIAEKRLQLFENKWTEIYPDATTALRSNWSHLSPYCRYPDNIRRLLYTSNPTEVHHEEMQKVIAGAKSGKDGKSVSRLIYWIAQTGKEAENPPFNWDLVFRELIEAFGSRILSAATG
jgi:putative transposase